MVLARWECIISKLNFLDMNEYAIDIQGIHCSGCINLIKMVLEDDLRFNNVLVKEDDNKAKFKTEDTIEDLKKKLDKIFNTELTNYKYSNLIQL